MGCTSSSAAPVSPMKSDAVKDSDDRDENVAHGQSVPASAGHASADDVVRRLVAEPAEPGPEAAPAASAVVQDAWAPPAVRRRQVALRSELCRGQARERK